MVNTRSNCAELRGPLEPPQRVRGGQSAGRPSGDVAHGNPGPQERTDGSPGGNHQRSSPASDPGEGNLHGGPRMLGGYPETPLHPRNPDSVQGGANQTPGQRARRALEGMQSSRARRAFRGFQSLTDFGSGESEGSAEINFQRGNRRICEGMEPLGGEKNPLPSSSQEIDNEVQEEGLRKEAELQLSQFLRPSPLEEDHRAPPDSCRSVPQHPLGLRISKAILDSLETISSNFSTFDCNSETNFQTLVNKIESSNKAIKLVDDRVFHVLKQMNKPLPIEMTAHHSEMITVIYKDVESLKDNAKDQKEISKEIAIMIKSLQEAQKINTDFILSSLKQDAIIKREEINKSIREVKEIIINNEHKNDTTSALILSQLESIKKDFENFKNIEKPVHKHPEKYAENPKARTPVINQQNNRDEPPHIPRNTPIFNNPYMQEELKNNDHTEFGRNSTPYRTMDMSAINKLMPPIQDWPKFST